jgi:hypothetical protein
MTTYLSGSSAWQSTLLPKEPIVLTPYSHTQQQLSIATRHAPTKAGAGFGYAIRAARLITAIAARWMSMQNRISSRDCDWRTSSQDQDRSAPLAALGVAAITLILRAAGTFASAAGSVA